jgi:trimethylamine--corrinoid protein Co-methyltransferase
MPCSVIAGATDSKVPDAQAGYEKALNVNTAIQAGANLITQAAGMQAGLMGVSFAAMVVDNEMIGSLMRANVPPEITEETLNLNMIKSVLEGDGHFLGHAETYQRMKSDFLYPDIADRRTIEEWVAAGSQDMARCARTYAEEILQAHTPPKLDPRFIEKFSLSPFWHTRDHNGG